MGASSILQWPVGAISAHLLEAVLPRMIDRHTGQACRRRGHRELGRRRDRWTQGPHTGHDLGPAHGAIAIANLEVPVHAFADDDGTARRREATLPLELEVA